MPFLVELAQNVQAPHTYDEVTHNQEFFLGSGLTSSSNLSVRVTNTGDDTGILKSAYLNFTQGSGSTSGSLGVINHVLSSGDQTEWFVSLDAFSSGNLYAGSLTFFRSDSLWENHNVSGLEFICKWYGEKL